MCRKLAGTDRLLSPAKFTNSVHNAASGHWTISARCRAPSTFVSAFGTSVGAGLLEAVSQAKGTKEPVLLVMYDVANTLPLSDICAVEESMAAAVVLETSVPVERDCATLPVGLRYIAAPTEPPAPAAVELRELAKANPVGQSLALLERCAVACDRRLPPLRFPVTPYGCVELSTGR